MTAASPRTSPSALRSPLPPSITHSTRPSSVSPRASRSCSSSVQTTAFSVEPSRKPSGTLPPSRVIPRTTITVCWATTTPSMNSATTSSPSSRRARCSRSRCRVRRTTVRLTALLLLPRVRRPSGRASRLASYWRVDTPARSCCIIPASIGSTRCIGAGPALFSACVRCTLAVLFVIGGSLAPAWGPFVLVDAILTPTREPSLLSSQIQQGPGHLPRAAYAAFERKWAKRCPGVVMSLREGGDELLTFFTFPKGQWKTLRTTNTIERLHEEFRRRVKTQGSLPSEDAAVVLLFSLVATGQIKLRRIDGWQKIATVLSQNTLIAA